MNPWIQFLKQHNSLPHDKNKDFIKYLSHQWKNHKSQLVTLHIDYVNKLSTEKQSLQLQVQQLQQQISQLQQQLDFYDYYYYYYHCLSGTANETFEDLCS